VRPEDVHRRIGLLWPFPPFSLILTGTLSRPVDVFNFIAVGNNHNQPPFFPNALTGAFFFPHFLSRRPPDGVVKSRLYLISSFPPSFCDFAIPFWGQSTEFQLNLFLLAPFSLSLSASFGASWPRNFPSFLSPCPLLTPSEAADCLWSPPPYGASWFVFFFQRLNTRCALPFPGDLLEPLFFFPLSGSNFASQKPPLPPRPSLFLDGYLRTVFFSYSSISLSRDASMILQSHFLFLFLPWLTTVRSPRFAGAPRASRASVVQVHRFFSPPSWMIILRFFF